MIFIKHRHPTTYQYLLRNKKIVYDNFARLDGLQIHDGYHCVHLRIQDHAGIQLYNNNLKQNKFILDII